MQLATLSVQHPSRTSYAKSNPRIRRMFQYQRKRPSAVLGMLWHCTSGHITRGTTRLSKPFREGCSGVQYDHNAPTTKVMTKQEQDTGGLVDGGKMEHVGSFGCWGSRITNDADCKAEVKTRLAMGVTAMVNLTKLWKKKQGNKHQYKAMNDGQ